MPLYDYQCRACGKVTEVRHGFKETFEGTCAACGGEMKRVFNRGRDRLQGLGFLRDRFAQIERRRFVVRIEELEDREQERERERERRATRRATRRPRARAARRRRPPRPRPRPNRRPADGSKYRLLDRGRRRGVRVRRRPDRRAAALRSRRAAYRRARSPAMPICRSSRCCGRAARTLERLDARARRDRGAARARAGRARRARDRARARSS